MTELDPYAPPKAESVAQPRTKRTRSERAFAAERRSVALVAFYSVITLGLYASVWYIRRTPFVNGLKSDKQLQPALPWVLLGLEVFTYILAFIGGATGTDIERPFTLGAGVLASSFAFAWHTSSDRTSRAPGSSWA